MIIDCCCCCFYIVKCINDWFGKCFKVVKFLIVIIYYKVEVEVIKILIYSFIIREMLCYGNVMFLDIVGINFFKGVLVLINNDVWFFIVE